MELIFTLIIIGSVVLFLFFGIPTIYDWIVYRGNHLSFINPKTRTAFRGGGKDPITIFNLFGVLIVIFVILVIMNEIFH